jgi:hypothetical protein
MANEHFSNYEFEMSAAPLEGGKWASYLEIRTHVGNGADQKVIFPRQRIAEDDMFDSEHDAIAEARRFAMNHVSSGEF